MSHELRSNNKNVFLVGGVNHQITGTKLPSNRQVLAVLFFNIREVKLSVSESANLVIRECLIFWEKARIPTRKVPNCTKKLNDLYIEWRALQKNSQKSNDIFKRRELEFKNNLDNLFDIAHANALETIKIAEDRNFLARQREPGRPGYLAGIDKKLAQREDRANKKKVNEEQRRNTQLNTASSSSISHILNTSNESDSESSSLNETFSDNGVLLQLPEDTSTQKLIKRGTTDIITPKLVAALDRCQLSVRDTVYVLQATAEALGHNVDELIINKSSIHRIREAKRRERADAIKVAFKNNLPPYVTVHWDGKLLPALNVRDSKEERLPIVVTFGDMEQLISVPKLQNSTGKEQALAVYNALKDWSLEHMVQFLCFDTTASNTGRFNGACILIEQKLNRELFYFPCRHHIYELVLRSVFEAKISQVANSPDIPFFKQLRDSWKNINAHNFESGQNDLRKCLNKLEAKDLLKFYKEKLQEPILRNDYRELIELCILFLGGTRDVAKIRPPGAMHQARWMARAIYSLKMFLLRAELKLSNMDKEALKDICLFVVIVYVKPWLHCVPAVQAPYQDLLFLKALKAYEAKNKIISKAALNKFSQHLWYLSEAMAAFALFDKDVNLDTKKKMVNNLDREPQQMDKRFITADVVNNHELFGKLI